jgi:hypothetical protein
MRKRIITAVIGATLLAIVPTVPALARANQTIAITCDTSGQRLVVDASALNGQTTANEVYNAVNPFGETCEVVTVG